MDENQREYFLKEQLRAITSELGRTIIPSRKLMNCGSVCWPWGFLRSARRSC